MKEELEVHRNLHTAGQVAPSIGSTVGLTKAGNKTLHRLSTAERNVTPKHWEEEGNVIQDKINS